MKGIAVENHTAERLAAALRTRRATVCVVGMGYVGLPLARALVAAKFPVIGYDIDQAKIEALQRGESYIAQIPNQTIGELNASGRFEPSRDPSVFARSDVIVICVPTPLTETRDPDLSYIVNTGREIAKWLREGQLVVLESTTYPGTTDQVLRPILEATGLTVEEDFFLAFSPEREDPGNQQFETRTIPKVVGGAGPRSSALARDLYAAAVDRVVPVSSTQIAEATKILENTYRAVNIAMVNEMKVLFGKMGIDIWEVIDASKTKPFGFQAFYPGPGLGGHCIPIDPFYLTWIARKYGLDTQFIELAGRINTGMPHYVVQRIGEVLNLGGRPFKGSRVLVLGLAYKKDIDDTRESPSFEIMKELVEAGAEVSFHDPFFKAMPEKRDYHMKLRRASLTEPEIAGQDCVVIVTDHSAYDYAWLVEHAKAIVDTRGATRHLGSLPNVHRA